MDRQGSSSAFELLHTRLALGIQQLRLSLGVARLGQALKALDTALESLQTITSCRGLLDARFALARDTSVGMNGSSCFVQMESTYGFGFSCW